MVLGSDLTLSAFEVFHRVIHTSVALEHLLGAQSLAQCDQLMPKTNTKYRLTECYDVSDQRDGLEMINEIVLPTRQC